MKIKHILFFNKHSELRHNHGLNIYFILYGFHLQGMCDIKKENSKNVKEFFS